MVAQLRHIETLQIRQNCKVKVIHFPQYGKTQSFGACKGHGGSCKTGCAGCNTYCRKVILFFL
jgi:hypothetical protein